MRLQKIVIISTLVGLNFSSAFSQSERKTSDEFFRANSARSAADDKLAEILQKKQAELDAKENATGRSRPVTASPAPTPVEPRQPTAVAPPPAATAPSENRLEEVLRKKQAELDAKEIPATLERTVTQPAVTSRPPVTELKPSEAVLPTVDQSVEGRLQEALRKKQAELDARELIAAPRSTPAVPVTNKEQTESEKRIQRIEAEIKAKEEAIKKRAAAQSKADASAQQAEAQVTKSKPSKKQAAPSAPAPAPDLGTKDGRLADLLRRYKADEITPHDYHLERAKILAEP